jgi:hypothetical protein
MKTVLALCVSMLSPIAAYCQPSKLHPDASSLTTYITQVVPLVIVGEGWSQRVVLTNVDDTRSAIGTLQFFTQNGQPWTVSLTNSGNGSIFAFSLQPGQTLIYETVTQQNPQTLGWALIEENTSGLGDLLGQTIFRKQTLGQPDFMCSMILGGQAYRRLTVFFDNTGGKYTGMGILTSEVCTFSCNNADSLRVTVQDLSGNVVSQKTINQKKGVLYWMNLGADFPETNGRIGTFVVEPVAKYSTTLTGFSLQFAPNGAFTAITPFEN